MKPEQLIITREAPVPTVPPPPDTPQRNTTDVKKKLSVQQKVGDITKR